LLLSDPEKLKQMGISGRKRVLEHYTVEREANELIAFYRTLMWSYSDTKADIKGSF
jgi:glycosyltransferase involved in cell wall biosynthesis